MIDTVEVENPNPSDSVQHEPETRDPDEPPDYENKPEGTFRHIVNVVFFFLDFVYFYFVTFFRVGMRNVIEQSMNTQSRGAAQLSEMISEYETKGGS